MKRKIAVVWLSLMTVFSYIVIIITIAPNVEAPTTWYVDDVAGSSGPDDPTEDFISIQAAIDAALPGDTIFVYNGTYYENLVVAKTINLIGEDRYSTIVDAYDNGDAIFIDYDYVNVSDFTFTNAGPGINTYACARIYSDYNTLSNCILSSSYGNGMFVETSKGNKIIGNNITSNSWHGIYFNYVDFTNFTGNTVHSNSLWGLDLYSSDDNNITDNIYISNGGMGIYLSSSHRNNITNNTAFDSNRGIRLFSSDENDIIDNNFSWNFDYGIVLEDSHGNNITGNNLTNNDDGIYLLSSSSNNITENVISSNNKYGINLEFSDNNNVSKNSAFNNENNAIYILNSNNSHVYNNTIEDSGIILNGDMIEHWNTQNIDTSNNVNGKPVYYWKNQTGGKIPSGAGEVILANCSNVVVENQVIANNSVLIQLGFSSNNNVINNKAIRNIVGIYCKYSNNNSIKFNNASYNDNGIFFSHSNNNTIVNNNIISNVGTGISIIESSNNNKLHHNNIINNPQQIIFENDTCYDNVWDDGNGEGNYWSDYSGLDDGSGGRTAEDGIGDTEIPHPFTDQGIGYYQLDNFPLMSPFGNFSFLYEGWNLISIPFIQTDTSLSSVLSSISGSYDTIWNYNISDKQDYWKLNHTSKPTNLNDFNNIDNTMGFWIHVTEPGGILFEYPGTPPTEYQTIQLYRGWNMVGFPSLSPKNRTTALNNLSFNTHVDAIWTYNTAIQKWEEVEEGDMFYPGRGYWIYAKTKCEWEVPL